MHNAIFDTYFKWMAHVRLREEPKERYDKLFYEMMEKQWEQVQLDLSRLSGGYSLFPGQVVAVNFKSGGHVLGAAKTRATVNAFLASTPAGLPPPPPDTSRRCRRSERATSRG